MYRIGTFVLEKKFYNILHDINLTYLFSTTLLRLIIHYFLTKNTLDFETAIISKIFLHFEK